MNPESPWQAFHRQRLKFRELFEEAWRHHGKPMEHNASPKSVLAFAESLLLCPTEESALTHIGRDLEAAGMFRMLMENVATAYDKKSVLAAMPIVLDQTPFCLIASIVRARVLITIEKRGDSWT